MLELTGLILWEALKVFTFVFMIFTVFGLASALKEVKASQSVMIQEEVKRELARRIGCSALVHARPADDGEGYVFVVENVGELSFKVQSFNFYDVDFVKLGGVTNAYPEMAPGKAVTFSLKFVNPGIEVTRAIVTLESELEDEEILVKLK